VAPAFLRNKVEFYQEWRTKLGERLIAVDAVGYSVDQAFAVVALGERLLKTLWALEPPKPKQVAKKKPKKKSKKKPKKKP
jgi:hypothetical protein